MIRYAGQRDDYSCGPTAIINVMKWLGEKISYRDHKKAFCVACDCRPGKGTALHVFDRVLRRASAKRAIVNRRRWFSLEEIERHLRKDNGIIAIKFKWPDDKGSHYILLTDIFYNCLFRTINFNSGRAKYRITRWELKKIILKRRSQAVCWFITKTADATIGA